jgi:hypothetical protein
VSMTCSNSFHVASSLQSDHTVHERLMVHAGCRFASTLNNQPVGPYMPNIPLTKISLKTPAASATQRPTSALLVTSVGKNRHPSVGIADEVILVLPTVKLMPVLVLDEGGRT